MGHISEEVDNDLALRGPHITVGLRNPMCGAES